MKTPNNRSSQDTTADSKSKVESLIIGKNNIQIKSTVIEKSAHSMSPDRKPMVSQVVENPKGGLAAGPDRRRSIEAMGKGHSRNQQLEPISEKAGSLQLGNVKNQ
jgi:hypothetical protein